MRIALGVATLLTALATAVGGVWSLATGQPALLGIVCASLTLIFGALVYHDYQYFFGKR